MINFWGRLCIWLLTASEAPVALEVCSAAVSVHDLNEMQRWEGNLSLNEVMGITGGKGTLSCHLVLSLGTENMNSASLFELFLIFRINCPHPLCIPFLTFIIIVLH